MRLPSSSMLPNMYANGTRSTKPKQSRMPIAVAACRGPPPGVVDEVARLDEHEHVEHDHERQQHEEEHAETPPGEVEDVGQ